ncbi:MAG: branched-chain amino acid ABC transporter substrate-binding protein [Gemmataceae bacterium]
MLLRYLPLACILAVIAAGFALPRPSAVGDPDVIRIVSSLPRSGSARGQTDSIVDGIRLALKEVDYKLDVGGKRYRIDYLDLDDATAMAGAWTADAEIANANLAVRDPDVMVYIGTYNSAAARISMPILNRAHMLMVSPANTSATLTKPGTGSPVEPMCYRPSGEVNFVRVVPTDDVQGSLGAEWAQDMGFKRVYILDDNETYGKGVAGEFETRAKQIGIEILGHESIDNKSTEFSPLMTKIKGLNPDLIYFGGTTQTKAGQLIKDMVTGGLTCKMMAPDGCYEQAMIESAGADKLVGRFLVTFTGLTPDRLTSGAGLAFVEKHERLLGRRPSEAYAIYGYESGLVALEAIRKAGKKDREAVCKAGRTIKDFIGPSGLKWSFDENGDTTLQLMTGSRVIMTKDKTGKDIGDFEAMKDLIPRKK